MLKSFSLKNYKAFKYKTNVDIKPLTILVGENSAGKSTITDFLLLLNQTINTELVGNSINYTGKNIDLVGYERVINNKRSWNETLEIGLKLSDVFNENNYKNIIPNLKHHHSIAREVLAKFETPSRGISPKDYYLIDVDEKLGSNFLKQYSDYTDAEIKFSKYQNFLIQIKNQAETQCFLFNSYPLKGSSIDISKTYDPIERGNYATINYKKDIRIDVLSEFYNNFSEIYKILGYTKKYYVSQIKNIIKDQVYSKPIISHNILQYSPCMEDDDSWLQQYFDKDYYKIGPNDQEEEFCEVPDWLDEFVVSTKKSSRNSAQIFHYYELEGLPYKQSLRDNSESTLLHYMNMMVLSQFVSAKRLNIYIRNNKKELNSFEKIIIMMTQRTLLSMLIENILVYRDVISRNYLDWQYKHFKKALTKIHMVQPGGNNSIKKVYDERSLRDILGRGTDLFKNRYSKIGKNITLDSFDGTDIITWEQLLKKVNLDLTKIGFAYSIDVKNVSSKYSNLYEIEINDGSNTYGLHEVGYGLTKILSILFNLNYFRLLYNDDGIIIIREPESNIHPAAQSSIAKILVNPNTDEKSARVIVETHSEHFIRGVQLEIAKGNISKDDVSILYVGKRKNGNSYIKELELEEKGKFKSGYPKGFFESGFKEATELMKLQD